MATRPVAPMSPNSIQRWWWPQHGVEAGSSGAKGENASAGRLSSVLGLLGSRALQEGSQERWYCSSGSLVPAGNHDVPRGSASLGDGDLATSSASSRGCFQAEAETSLGAKGFLCV